MSDTIVVIGKPTSMNSRVLRFLMKDDIVFRYSQLKKMNYQLGNSDIHNYTGGAYEI